MTPRDYLGPPFLRSLDLDPLGYNRLAVADSLSQWVTGAR